MHLDYDTLTQYEKSILLLKLQEDADTIDEAYFTMVQRFKVWMEKNVSVEDYRDLLLSIPGTMMNTVPLLKDRWDEIKIATHKDCSALLSHYHTWFNCSVLKQVLQRAKILTNNDPAVVLCSLQSYTEEMLNYCKRNIFECPPPSTMSPVKGTTYFTLKTKDHQLIDKKQFTADEIHLLTAKIMTLFKIEEYVLQLCSFTKGCVELVYSIPLCIYAELFPLNEDQCRYLNTTGVSEITTKDYHHKLEHVSNIHFQICIGCCVCIPKYVSIYSKLRTVTLSVLMGPLV